MVSSNLSDPGKLQKTFSSERLARVESSWVTLNSRKLALLSRQLYVLKESDGDTFLIEPLSLDDFLAMSEENRAELKLAIDRPPAKDAFQIRWAELMEMTASERVQELSNQREVFEAKIKSTASPEQRVALASEIAETAFLINRACLSLNKNGVDTQEATLVAETLAITNYVLTLIMETPLAVSLFRTFQARMQSQTLAHVTRVFAMATGFFVYYNRQRQAGLAAKIRIAFAQEYASIYRQLLPSLNESWIKADNLIRLPILSQDQIRVLALGALLHDVGKVTDLDYFDGSAPKDDIKIRMHPITGAGIFLRTYGTNYEDAMYIVGDHHNYLFHPDGYGLTQWERSRSQRSIPAPQCSVADSLASFTSGEALAYFPVEMCALVDVYDALSDPSRQYRKSLSSYQALAFMNETFVKTHKLDPVLFDVFIDYLKTLDSTLSPELGFTPKYQRRR
jgi:HD-GYP domain-containing protein (c-di-GMP phosphodiesterase class II)